MDWKSGLLSFAIIFFAELGDKTQLMIMSMSARSKSPQMIFFGAAAALIASSLVAVLAGEAFLRAVPLRMVRFGSGVAFVGIGSLLLFRSFR
ncbi:MAG TPA: TMEM165/GDT1 family protein [Symbiobacteriaceae bacterium]